MDTTTKQPHSTTYKSTIITTLQSVVTTKASDNVLVLSADETNLLANMLKRPNETDDTTSQPTGISFFNHESLPDLSELNFDGI
jgi:hypothetical protein